MRAKPSTTKNLSVKIGNRVVSPALPVVDSSFASECDKEFDKCLGYYISENIPLESRVGLQTRERVLDKLSTLCREWIEHVCQKYQYADDIVAAAGGQIFTSGSYRLGVHEPGADIDTIVVAPNMCSREDFFGTNKWLLTTDSDDADSNKARDPDSLAERIRRHPDVTNFNAVEGAAVPILTFDWECVNIDLLFAKINTASVPSNFNIDDDAVLDGVDSATEKSLNGPRVTNLIAALVSGTEERYQSFLTVVRCVRKWAKVRGLYSNKLGYWGGVNINISVALLIQLYPNSCPASLLRKFFLLFKTWRWPNPVMLTKPHDAHLGLQVWSPYSALTQRQIAPIITPAYPAMNSSLSISRQTLQILHEEICRAYDILDKIWKSVQVSSVKKEQEENSDDDSQGSQAKSSSESELKTKSALFQELFQPSDFFISYPYYLSLCIVASNQPELQSWLGFVESRLRKLVSDLLGKSLPLSKIQLWPKKFDACCADPEAIISPAQRKNCVTYFIGFQVDELRMRGNQLNIEQQLQNFKQYELMRFNNFVSGSMDIYLRHYKVNELPQLVFFDFYKGGKAEAMLKKRCIRENDPKRIEARRVKKLEELKAKMAKLQSLREEKLKSAKEAETETEEVATTTTTTEESENRNDEDALLLESALDNIQYVAEGTTKSREEAELDRKKLLAGELLVEGGGGSDSDDDDDEVNKSSKDVAKAEAEEEQPKKKMKQECPELEALKKEGYSLISSDDDNDDGAEQEPVIKFGPNSFYKKKKSVVKKSNIQVSLRTKFDIVELDRDGRIIDKGDEDFVPCNKWSGRRGGFEFKLGARGLGYYRTGKKVVVPSNIAY